MSRKRGRYKSPSFQMLTKIKVKSGKKRITNPDTQRLINLGGPTHKKLIKEGMLDEKGIVLTKKMITHSKKSPFKYSNIVKSDLNTFYQLMEDEFDIIINPLKTKNKFKKWIKDTIVTIVPFEDEKENTIAVAHFGLGNIEIEKY